MKLLLSLLLFAASTCFAGADVTLLGGAGFPVSEFKPVEGGQSEKIGGAGGAGGFQLMIDIAPRISVGLDLMGQGFSEKTSDTLIAPIRSTFKSSIGTCLIGSRFGLGDDERLKPFFFIGLGMGKVALAYDIEPPPGFFWLDTKTSEKRRLIDDSDTALAGAMALGMDYQVSKFFSLGFEGRYTHVGETEFAVRNISASAPTSGQLKGSTSAIAFLIRGTLRFQEPTHPEHGPVL